MPTYAQTIDGNYIYAERAVNDKNGNDITTTYEPALPSKSGNSGKVLTVNSMATGLEWTTSTVPPTKPVVAGSGISITENANDITLAATDALPSKSGNANKILSVNSQATALQWVTKPSEPTPQENADWAAQLGVAKILNKPICIVNTTGGFRKTLTADDVSNGYVILTDSAGMYTGSYSYTNPTFVLFASFNQFRLNSGFATSAYDHLEVGLYSEGIVGNYVKYFDLPHQSIVDDAGKDWGISGWWSLTKDKTLYMYTKLYFTQNSVQVGDEIWFKGTAMIVGSGIFN